MKALFDVGGFRGEFTEAAFLHFDLIHLFEPSPSLYEGLFEKKATSTKMGWDKVHIHPYGLWNKFAYQNLYHSSTRSGTIFKDKVYYDVYWDELEEDLVEDCVLVPAHLIRPIGGAQNFMKLNCEGCEVGILESLADSGMINAYSSIFVDFDFYKSQSLHAESIEKVKYIMKQYKDKIYDATGRKESHEDAIKRWMTHI